jgi:hypothetical protein
VSRIAGYFLRKHIHQPPILSLANAFSAEELAG